MAKTIVTLPGDGIGPEVTSAAIEALKSRISTAINRVVPRSSTGPTEGSANKRPQPAAAAS